MKIRHHLIVDSTCPIDGAPDKYDVFVYADRVVECEEIVKHVAELTSDPVFQEQFTQNLADRLECRVKTVGTHVRGKVMTVVICEPEAITTHF
jgi:NADPH-dependent 7-cyano-7-deazaguanine reductase QueF